MAVRSQGMGRPVAPASPGADGKSAYQVWLDAGHSGTVGDFLASLVGAPGAAAQLRVSNGYLQWSNGGAWSNLVALADLKGNPGDPGTAGKSAELQVAGEYIQWRQTGGTWANLVALSALAGTPGAAGKSVYEVAVAAGYSGTAAQWLASLVGAPGNDGKSVEMQVASGNIQWRVAGGTWATLVTLASLKGDPGAAGFTLVGQVVVGQTAAVAIALGIREVTVALAGAVVGERYQVFARSYRLNGGASVAGRPAGYALIDCVCNTAGQVTVSLNAPLLAIGSSYALTCDVLKANAS